jgi:hypothetical protein
MLALTLALIALDACKGPRARLPRKPREAHRTRFERPHTRAPPTSGERGR